jgi:hypothetical protein
MPRKRDTSEMRARGVRVTRALANKGGVVSEAFSPPPMTTTMLKYKTREQDDEEKRYRRAFLALD